MALDPLREAPDGEVGRLVDDFLQSQRAPRTRETYGADLAIFLRWLAGRGVHALKVERPDVDRYRNWLSELVGPDGKPASNGRPRYAPATISKQLSAVRAFYSYVVDRRLLPGSPAAGVKSPRVRREPRGRAITTEHVRVLLAGAAEDGAQSEAIICLLLLNGLRVSEVCGANVEDLRSEPGGGHSLVVRGKGGKEVPVALNKRTEAAVLAAVGGRQTGPLFRRQDGRRTRHGAGAPWLAFNRQAVNRLLVDLGVRTGLLGEAEGQVSSLYPHRMRHTFVTSLLDLGVSLVSVQDAARHSSAETTRLYDRTRTAFGEHPTHLLTFDE